jgi:hypothetical protein
LADHGGDHFMMQVQDERTDLLSVVIRSGGSEHGALPDVLEVAIRSQLHVSASFVHLLAFDPTPPSYEMVVLAVLQGPPDSKLPGSFRMFLPHELLGLGLATDTIGHIHTAREIRAAERDTAEPHVAEQHMAELGVAIRRACDRSLNFLDQRRTTEDDSQGWGQYFDSHTVGLLSTAQGLLAYVHAGQRGEIIDEAAKTIERMQNPDGGWQVRRALVGHESAVSVTESTCYALWALLEAGRTPERLAVRDGIAWLEQTQQDDGGWRPSVNAGEAQVSATAGAVRILARCDRPAAAEHGAAWLRAAQRRDGGWGATSSSGFSSPAYTAHAVLALLATGTPASDPAVRRACGYLEETFRAQEDEPWAPISANTVVDEKNASRLDFRHFSTPWALAALSSAGRDLTDPTVWFGTHRLLGLQEVTGAWRCQLTAPDAFTIWAVHDALFALRAVSTANRSLLTPLVRTRHADRERQLLYLAIGRLLTERPTVKTRRWRLTAWLSLLTVAVMLLAGAQFGLFEGLQSQSGPGRAVAAIAAALVVAILPPVIVEEYKLRRAARRGQPPSPNTPS